MASSVRLQMAFAEARKHIMDLANPFLFLEIKKLFELMKTHISRPEKILESFSAVDMPANTRTILKHLIEEMGEAGNLPNIERALSEFLDELSQRDILTWNELKFFLAIPEIKELSNDNLKKVMCQVYQKHIENLRDLIVELLGAVVARAVNESLATTEYVNMNTMIAEVINFVPEKNDGILTYWGRPPIFFDKKTLYLNDPDGPNNLYGSIEKCLKENGSLYFQLHDQSEIVISPHHRVTTVEKRKFKFWNSICDSVLKKSSNFELRSKRRTSSIPLGDYIIESVNEKSGPNILKVIGMKHALYTEISLESIQEPSKKYLISVYHFKDDKEVQKVELKIVTAGETSSQTSSAFGKKLEIPNQEFCEEYFVLVSRKYDINGINSENVNNYILIKDERNEAEERCNYLRDVQKQLADLLQKLLTENPCALLNKLIANLIEHKLAHIDVELLVPDHTYYLDELKAISTVYETKLQITRTPSDLLKSLVIEANYVSMIKKEKCSEVARTMELLKDSEQHIKGIEGRDTIFCIGNTGSGKSTTIGYFMGAEMEYFFNSVGDKVVKIKDGQEDKFPQIGQALGESETLYTSCYPTAVENVSLVDCPGFNDTRGGDYEICANMSIDQAVERSGRLKAIVVIIPVQSFLTDRANGVIELVETVRSRFPFTFNANSPENSRVYILITKASQAQVEATRVLETGQRYQILLNEARQALRRTEKNIEFGPTKQHGMQMRASVWEAFVTMNRRKQIDFIDTSNMRMKTRLIEKYVAEGFISKDLYIKAMQGPDMKRKFGKDVEMAADTWSRHIIACYQEDIPKSIADKLNEVKNRKGKLNELNEERNKLSGNIKSSRTTLETAEKAKEQAFLDDFDLPPEMIACIKEMKDRALYQINNDLKDVEISREKCSKEITELSAKINQIKMEISNIDGNICDLSNNISELSKGTFKDELYSMDYRGNEEKEVTVRYLIDSTVREERFIAGEEYREEDYLEESRSVVLKNYEGNFLHEAYIERKYCIVPKDKSLRAVFQKDCKWNEYEATLEGDNFEVDLGMIAEPTGKSLRYGFKTKWTVGGKMPWIKIHHTIPNSEYNSSTIVNKNGEIGALNAKKAELVSTLEGTATIAGKQKELNSLEQDLFNFGEEKSSLEKGREKLEHGIMQKALDDIIHNLTDKIMRYEIREKEIPKIINDINREILAIEKDHESLLWTKKRLALIVYNNWNVVELLRNFTDRVVNRMDKTEDRSDIAISCKFFIDAYDKHNVTMLKNCKDDIGIA